MRVCVILSLVSSTEVDLFSFSIPLLLHFIPQVCDSDTKLDPLATVELVKVLESNTRYGAVGGDVMILNLKDSYISFMSSLRYWMAFNVERACQSFFDCVSCISDPLGK